MDISMEPMSYSEINDSVISPNGNSLERNAEENINIRISTSTPLEVDMSNDISMENVQSELITQSVPEIDQKFDAINDNCTASTPKTPIYDFSKFSFLTKCSNMFEQDRCLRGCKWSPDGTCLLVNCDDKSLRLFDLPRELYNLVSWNDKSSIDDVSQSLQVVESGLIYDFDWYPFMSSWDPTTSCFISTSTNCPVHLYDAFTGHIRASYRGYDQYDEVAHAFCVSFDTSGTLIFCGYKNEIKIFDVTRPGRDCSSINTKKTGKQKGIISCINDNPDMPKIFAAGSYRKIIGVYTVDGSSLCQLVGQTGGLTQVKFSSNGVRLYSAGRKDTEILCWDLRYPGKTLFSLARPHNTNQRIYFDLSADDKYLVSGSTDGRVRIWNVNNVLGNKNEAEFEFTPHKDCVNGVSFHHQLSILATCSGQRHVPEVLSDDEDSQIFTQDYYKDIVDNSIKYWWIGSTV